MNAKRHAAENRKGQCASVRRTLFLLCFGHGPLNATVDELVAEGFTHIQCYCPRCRTTRLRPISWLPRISLGLTIARFQRGYAARSAVVHCTRSSRGGWKTFLGSRWGVEGSLPAQPTSVLSIVRCCRLVLRRPRAIPCPKLLMGSRRVLSPGAH